MVNSFTAPGIWTPFGTRIYSAGWWYAWSGSMTMELVLLCLVFLPSVLRTV